MTKAIEFLKNKFIIVKWTIWYFFIVWFILKFIFNFDMFSGYYWWKFLHATLHGFGGLVFGLIVYSAIPLYIATTLITYRKQELIIPIPFSKTVSNAVSKIFSHHENSETTKPESENTPVEPTSDPEPDFPPDLPRELHVPFTRVRNRLPVTSGISVYNQSRNPALGPQNATPEPEPAPETSNIPIPMDFDIADTIEPTMSDSIPTFKDIDFDIPIATEPESPELKNETTEYLKSKNIEYETYKNFIATEKFVIYEHSDKEFWIMDGDSWFAAGKQIDSPINELLSLAKQNDLQPVIYLASQNIMDIENTIKQFESSGVQVIKDLSELD